MKVVLAQEILRANDQLAELNRQRFTESRVFVVNVLGSPGAGKTTLLEALARVWQTRVRMGVIEGDLAGTVDAERIERLGLAVVQINTAGACHLDASMIATAADRLPLSDLDFLFIENVGNLVCPANFRLGEHLRLLLLSVPEGDDKPIKYPVIFRDLGAVIVSKIDLRPYLPFEVSKIHQQLQVLCPAARLFEVSALKGDGVEEVAKFLECERAEFFAKTDRPHAQAVV
ncbi:MAG: hydrogenase nickel incorporation protein HypB [Thermoguttaceae bacterium]|nr:hydrogenase nickel incorporation protein HypB [Thermoguttaceae bacterium]MDW8077315.1 hydrogenase nickel incorporation protein HypB [Thermoguttaceae bacterium]